MIFQTPSPSPRGRRIYGYAIARAMPLRRRARDLLKRGGPRSSPIAHAASNAEIPWKQGHGEFFEVFVDTLCDLHDYPLVVITRIL
jgi:hypothetical protein